MFEEVDTFNLNEVQPDMIIQTGRDLRSLSTYHWDYGYKLINESEHQYICVGKFYGQSDTCWNSTEERVPQYEWYLYKYNNKIWYRTKMYGEVVAQDTCKLS